MGINFVCEKDGCKGHLRYVADEYGSLAQGGSYEIYRCEQCGRHVYVPLPD